MRLVPGSTDGFLRDLGGKVDEIQGSYLRRIADLVRTAGVRVMLGDSTVTGQETFDPARVGDFYRRVAGRLDGWAVQDVSTSNNEDVRRIFIKFERMEGNYLLSGHMSVQFHVLLYYRPDQRVVDCQKELSDLVDLTKDKERQMADAGDRFVLAKLREMGYRDFDHQKLFEILYEDDELRERVYGEIEGGADADLEGLSVKKAALFDELDSLLLETYRMEPVLIDDARLVTGEEGCLVALDLEFVRDGSREGAFDSRKIPDRVRRKIAEDLDLILSALDAG